MTEQRQTGNHPPGLIARFYAGRPTRGDMARAVDRLMGAILLALSVRLHEATVGQLGVLFGILAHLAARRGWLRF